MSWFTDRAPYERPQPSVTEAQIIAAYEQYLGRTPSAAEVASHLDNPNAVEAIRTSAEAVDHATSAPVPDRTETGGYTGKGTAIASDPGAYRASLLGFDASRLDSAAGSLKYDAMRVLESLDPNDPGSWAKAKAALEAKHPGQYAFDDTNQNIDLRGTSDGYIGIRPMDRSTPSGGNAWQWMAYNNEVRGPSGEGAGSGSANGATLAGLNGSGSSSWPSSGSSGANSTGSVSPQGSVNGVLENGNNPTYWQDVSTSNFGSLLEPWNTKFEYPAFEAPGSFVAGTLNGKSAPTEQDLLQAIATTGQQLYSANDRAGSLVKIKAALDQQYPGVYALDQTTGQIALAPNWQSVASTLPSQAVPATTNGVPDWSTDPGYEFRVKEGQKALERSAAAKGTLLTGGTLKGLNQYAQNVASDEYQTIYNRKFNEWQTDYNKAQAEYTQKYNKAIGEYQQAFNVFSNNQGNIYNRLAGLAGLGQSSTGQLGANALGYAQLNSNTLANNANSLASLYSSIGNSQAAGTVGSANAWMQGLGNLANTWNQTGYTLAYLNR